MKHFEQHKQRKVRRLQTRVYFFDYGYILQMFERGDPSNS